MLQTGHWEPEPPRSFTLDLPGAPRRVGIIDIGPYEVLFAPLIPALQPGVLALLAGLIARLRIARTQDATRALRICRHAHPRLD